ncbi:NADH dehydrogenase [Cricetibacter osteomyelitidis]|uniref:NADH dehydrogenase n=1 Tax=Cricetibacter osteomyelitidis TaxID=1521931 RepID=A0A4V2T237_9PAST|nr:NAD(P)/FAD-dependent oxidoreductase [Cricetibacter osteomyelitidis]TCP95963.1 NADH dehydrogenase [Cricetibacter osteomyelitidis]
MKNIVVVGGGAGGLELATHLGNTLGRKKRANVTLVDKNATHLWKPLLHEVATGVLEEGIDALSYRSHARNHHFSFVQGEITGLNRTQKYVELAPVYGKDGDMLVIARRVPYDYLVIAIGSKSNDFGTPGVAKHCIFLDNPTQALRFQNRMLELFLKFTENHALDEIGEEEFKQQLVENDKVNIAIVGGGATGVELSAELYHAVEYISHYGYGAIDDGHLQVTLIEAGERLLPALPESLSEGVKIKLESLGVKVKTHTMITEAYDKGLRTKDGQDIKADLMVWAAGVKTSEITKQFDSLATNHINQIEIKPTLQTTVDDSIFAIGDCAFLMQANGKPVPPRGQAANQMAVTCAKNITALLDNKPLKDFVFNDKGSLVSLSQFTAFGSLLEKRKKGAIKIEGRLARLAYLSLYRAHQTALHGCFKTGLMLLVKGINRFIRPSLKLH